MSDIHILDQLANATVRIDALHLIPQIRPADELLRAVEMIEGIPQALLDTMPKYFKKLHETGEFDDLFAGDGTTGREAWDDLFCHMLSNGKCGFLAIISRPMMTPYKKGSSSMSYSWGHTWHDVIYAATLDQLVEAAVAWAEDRDKDDRERNAA